MREILFRGKDQYNDWIYGYLCQYRGDSIADNGGDLLDDSDYYIRDWTEKIDTGFYGCNYKVRTSTIGQFTGLIDKNGRKIFEGDIVAVPLSGKPAKGIVEYFKTDICGFTVITQPQYSNYVLQKNYAYEVIGNIHDNPELLEADK